MNQTELAFLALLVGTTVGCASSAGTDGMGSPAQAGTTGSGGSNATAGAGATAGGASGHAGGAVGGTSNAGGTGGLAASGGVAGSAPSAGGMGGPSGGKGGTAGDGGSAGTGTEAPMPSPGCGKSARPAGGQVAVAGQSLHLFPTSYDGTKPFPLLIALHACGNPNTEFVGLTNGTGLETNYVRTFPNTPDAGQCWSNYSGDVARILSQYDDLLNNYCVDMKRVFGIAHSSGAQMLVNILSHKTDAQHLNFKGISPVAADPYNVAVPMPVLYIDGKMDNQRSATSAINTVAKFRAANLCADTSKPYAPVMTCTSTDSGHPTVDPGCIAYDSCSAPTIWCSHDDPSYGGTEHGVPCFAVKAMYDVFASLR